MGPVNRESVCTSIAAGISSPWGKRAPPSRTATPCLFLFARPRGIEVVRGRREGDLPVPGDGLGIGREPAPVVAVEQHPAEIERVRGSVQERRASRAVIREELHIRSPLLNEGTLKSVPSPNPCQSRFCPFVYKVSRTFQPAVIRERRERRRRLFGDRFPLRSLRAPAPGWRLGLPRRAARAARGLGAGLRRR